MIRRPPRSTRVRSSAASDVYKRQVAGLPPQGCWMPNQGSPGPGLCRSIRGSLLSARNPYGPGEQAGAGLSVFEGAPLVVGQSAPDSRLLTALDGPFQTGGNDLAATADG